MNINTTIKILENLLYRHQINEEKTWVLPAQKQTILTYEEEKALISILPVLKAINQIYNFLK